MKKGKSPGNPQPVSGAPRSPEPGGITATTTCMKSGCWLYSFGNRVAENCGVLIESGMTPTDEAVGPSLPRWHVIIGGGAPSGKPLVPNGYGAIDGLALAQILTASIKTIPMPVTRTASAVRSYSSQVQY